MPSSAIEKADLIEPSMSILKRYNVQVRGRGQTPMVFAHGLGCDQNMWRLVTPAFEENYKVVLFDYIGHGKTDASLYDRKKYETLGGFAEDVIEICKELKLSDVTFVGHSVSASIGILAAAREPSLFKNLILVSPSPCFINDGDYVGGFSKANIEELLDFLDSNHLGWSNTMAPTIMGNSDRPELGTELANSFCQTDPEVAKHFARVTFLADNRADLPSVTKRTLILQSMQDAIAPVSVGEYMQRSVRNSTLVIIPATGHCPHLSAPAETVTAIDKFLSQS